MNTLSLVFNELFQNQTDIIALKQCTALSGAMVSGQVSSPLHSYPNAKVIF